MKGNYNLPPVECRVCSGVTYGRNDALGRSRRETEILNDTEDGGAREDCLVPVLNAERRREDAGDMTGLAKRPSSPTIKLTA